MTLWRLALSVSGSECDIEPNLILADVTLSRRPLRFLPAGGGRLLGDLGPLPSRELGGPRGTTLQAALTPKRHRRRVLLGFLGRGWRFASRLVYDRASERVDITGAFP